MACNCKRKTNQPTKNQKKLEVETPKETYETTSEKVSNNKEKIYDFYGV